MTDTTSDTAAAGDGSDLPAAWTGPLDDAGRALVAAKGWRGPGDVVQSYANLEKLMGADRAGRTVVPPKDGDAAEAFDAFYDRIGQRQGAHEVA
jgi:hypothetical protein